MSTQHPQIIDIPRERLAEAAEVMTCAFEQYPMMKFFFQGSRENHRQHVYEAMHIMALIRLELGDYLKGVEENGKLVAVACINKPERPAWPASLDKDLARFQEIVGASAMERMGQYGELTEKFALQEPHFYLVAIGVHPDEQGKGYGRMLLNEAQRLSQAHPTSKGVALDTETQSNLALYQHCGYEITAQSNIGELPIWFLFQPNES